MNQSWEEVILPGDGPLRNLVLLEGSHMNREKGVCVMEAVAWLAGEPHTDRPKCACPVISAFARRFNDRLGEEDRQRLREFIPRLVGSKASRSVEVRRGFLAADFAVRVFAPIALETAKLPEWAAKLRALAPVVDKSSALVARDCAREACTYAAAATAAAYAAYAAAADAAATYVSAIAASAAVKAHLVEAHFDLLRAMLEIRE